MKGLRGLCVLLGACVCVVAFLAPGWAQDTFTLRGRVVDGEGQPVAAAVVALYKTANVRRPADFITPPTIDNGSYTVELPVGKYWAVARQRQGERFGPLQPTDRHSGAPVEFSGEPAELVTVDFTVTTLREIEMTRQAPPTATAILRARLVDQAGAPVAQAYLFAWKERGGQGIPDFVSPATDRDGTATLVLPPGSYFIGADRVFPPAETRELRELRLSADNQNLTIDLEVP